jgi:hypothetical protein
MSTQRRDSQQLQDPEHDISLISKPQNHTSKNLDIANDMEFTYQLPTHFELSTTKLPMPETQTESTKTLHVEQDGKPAITLTTYKHSSSSHDESTSLLHLFKPIHDDEIKAHTYSTLVPATEKENIYRSAMELRLQLEEHFEGLKREFEVKRRRSWTPLRAWSTEDWDWDWEGGGAEVEWLVDWC